MYSDFVVSWLNATLILFVFTFITLHSVTMRPLDRNVESRCYPSDLCTFYLFIYLFLFIYYYEDRTQGTQGYTKYINLSK